MSTLARSHLWLPQSLLLTSQPAFLSWYFVTFWSVFIYIVEHKYWQVSQVTGKQNWPGFPHPLWNQQIVVFTCLLGQGKVKAATWSNPIQSLPFVVHPNTLQVSFLSPFSFFWRPVSWTQRYQGPSTREAEKPDYLWLLSWLFTATENLSFPCKFKPFALTFKVSRCFITAPHLAYSAGTHDLRDLFQPKRFYSMILFYSTVLPDVLCHPLCTNFF